MLALPSVGNTFLANNYAPSAESKQIAVHRYRLSSLFHTPVFSSTVIKKKKKLFPQSNLAEPTFPAKGKGPADIPVEFRRTTRRGIW